MVLINAVKDVAKALAELISATKCAAGKAADDPSMFQLKSAAKVRLSKTLLRNKYYSPFSKFSFIPHEQKNLVRNTPSKQLAVIYLSLKL